MTTLKDLIETYHAASLEQPAAKVLLRNRLLVAAYRGGVSTEDLMHEFGITRTYVLRLIRENTFGV